MKNAVKIGQSPTSLSYAEREHFGATLKKSYKNPETRIIGLTHQCQLLNDSNKFTKTGGNTNLKYKGPGGTNSALAPEYNGWDDWDEE